MTGGVEDLKRFAANGKAVAVVELTVGVGQMPKSIVECPVARNPA